MDRTKHSFTRKTSDGKIVKTTYDKAQQVKIPKEDYIELLESYDLINSNEHKCITMSEYNGLEKALRICRSRALQQIDKAKADKHGYTIKNIKKKKYTPEVNREAYYITLSTPYSIKIPYADVMDLLKADFRDFYNYIEIPRFEDERGNKHKLNAKQFFKCLDELENPIWQERDFLLSNCQFGKNVKKFFSGISVDKLVFEISEISTNIAQGRYEVSYWSTGSL